MLSSPAAGSEDPRGRARDGFQNEPEIIATDDKVRLIELPGRTGICRLEVTSFVRPDVDPQLADAREVLERIELPEEVCISVLVPNKRGLESAFELRDRIDEVNVLLSASETHNQKNVNRSIQQSLFELERCCRGPATRTSTRRRRSASRLPAVTTSARAAAHLQQRRARHRRRHGTAGTRPSSCW